MRRCDGACTCLFACECIAETIGPKLVRAKVSPLAAKTAQATPSSLSLAIAMVKKRLRSTPSCADDVDELRMSISKDIDAVYAKCRQDKQTFMTVV